MFPDLYGEYIQRLADLGKKPNKRLVRFATRYKFAGQIEWIKLLDSSADSAAVYTLGLRIALGYSAFETLSAYLGKSNIPIHAKPASVSLRSDAASKLKAYLLAESTGKNLRQLEKFYLSKGDSDINPVVTAIRHSMFHGQFNPSAAGARSKAAQKVLLQIDLALFSSMNDLAKTVFGDLISESVDGNQRTLDLNIR